MSIKKGRQRTQKWYLANEKKVLKAIGLKPCKGSGNGMLEKEDGFNDEVIAQLKSTDKDSYRLSQDDLKKLKYHATVDHKLSLFLIEYLQYDELWFCCMKEDLVGICLSMFKDEVIAQLKNEGLDKDDLVPELEGEPDEEIEWEPPKRIGHGNSSKTARQRDERYKGRK